MTSRLPLQLVFLSLYTEFVRVLLLNLYFPPDTSATANMAQTVVDALAASHDVTVLCGRPSYDPAERRAWRLFQTENIGRVTVIRVGSTDYPRFQMNKRIFNYLSYVLLSIPRALVQPCDVILAMTDPPFEGIVAAFVATLKRKPFVYNIRDMYPDMAIGGSLVAPGLLSRVWEKLHRWALRRATRIVVLGEDMRNRVVAKGIPTAKISVVRDGVDLPARSSLALAYDNEVIRTIRSDFRFVLLHAGNLGFYGAWDTLLEGARQFSAEGIGMVFVGEGAERDRLIAAAKDLPNVRFLPFFPGNRVSSVLAAADAHLVTIKRGLEGVVVPSKMYGILAAGKPIIAVAPRECDVVSIGEAKGFSIAVDPDQPAEFANAVRQLARDPLKRAAMAAAAMNAAPEFARELELTKLRHVIELAALA